MFLALKRWKMERVFRRWEKGCEHPVHFSLRPFEQHRCLFIHIPKTGGVSVSHGLFGCHAGGHLRWSDYRALFCHEHLEGFFKFTIVRHPLSRLYSAFTYLPQSPWPHNRIWASRHLSRFSNFEQFVDEWLGPENLRQCVHFPPQWSFLCENSSQVPDLDFVGRFERLPEDYAWICQQLSLPSDLPHKNRSRELKPVPEFSAATVDKVRQIYARDFEIFGY